MSKLKQKKSLEIKHRHKKVLKLLTENDGNLSEAMREANYSPGYIKSGHIKKSKSWNDLVEKALPDTLLLKVHKEGLSATRKIQKIVGRDDDGAPEYELVETEDYLTRHRYLDTAYKIKGKETQQINQQIFMPVQVIIGNDSIQANIQRNNGKLPKTDRSDEASLG